MGSVATDSATLSVSKFFYFFSTGSVATNTALSVATLATNKHFHIKNQIICAILSQI